jgi:DNA-binding NarL/FixJ family response regulator
VILRGDEEAFPFLLKQSAGEELVTAIEQVLRGHVYQTSPMVKQVMERMASPVETGVQLTPRQREVLRLIVEGRRKKEIAAVLNVSTRTVESHKYQMMQVLGLNSTAELIRHPLQHRLVTESPPDPPAST